jgi:prepilin-type N-terminal cleavage/methylation domain-containing protein
MHNSSQGNGFTLVEVIVTAVIIAIIALVSIQLYRGFVREAKRNQVENVAASAADFLQTAFNMEIPIPSCESTADIRTPICGREEWHYQLPGGNTVRFVCPEGMIITINTATLHVQADLDGCTSEWVQYAAEF